MVSNFFVHLFIKRCCTATSEQKEMQYNLGKPYYTKHNLRYMITELFLHILLKLSVWEKYLSQ